MTFWFSSDHHFNHANIINLSNRPFKATKTQTAIEVHNEALITNHNAVVSPDDTVLLLGDFGMGDIDATLELIPRLMGHKVLITGNHDRCFKGGKNSKGMTPAEWEDYYIAAGFEKVFHNVALSQFGDFPPVMLSHFPYTGDHFDGDRYEEYRATDSGLPILHGHTHSDKAISYSKRGTLQIHVGVDTWKYAPVPYDRFKTIIEAVTP
jgi:calcineurin-like phosphoesterase family protein